MFYLKVDKKEKNKDFSNKNFNIEAQISAFIKIKVRFLMKSYESK